MTTIDLDALKRLAEAATPGPWSACQEGKCSCGQVWSEATDNLVAVITRGKWGDEWPSIRLVGDTSFDQKAEAYMEKEVYGEVPDDIADANAAFVAAASPSVILALIARLERAEKGNG
jgi:hypothetical protein